MAFKNGALVSWRPAEFHKLGAAPDTVPVGAFRHDGIWMTADGTTEKTENMFLLTSTFQSGVMTSAAAARRVVESTVRLATNAAAGKLAEYYSSAAKAELQASREQIADLRDARLRSMFGPLKFTSVNSDNKANIGGYVLLRCQSAADLSGAESEDTVYIQTDGGKKRQRVVEGLQLSTFEKERYTVVSGALESTDSTTPADLVFRQYPVPKMPVDTAADREGLANLKLQLSMTDHMTLGLDTPPYEFMAHFTDLPAHNRERDATFRVVAAAIRGTCKRESAATLGLKPVRLREREMIGEHPEVTAFVNADHLQPLSDNVSECGWELWPRVVARAVDAPALLETHMWSLDPFRANSADERAWIDAFVNTAVEKCKNSVLITLTGTDSTVPDHWHPDAIISVEGGPFWVLGQTASMVTTGIVVAADALQDIVDTEFAPVEVAQCTARLITDRDVVRGAAKAARPPGIKVHPKLLQTTNPGHAELQRNKRQRPPQVTIGDLHNEADIDKAVLYDYVEVDDPPGVDELTYTDDVCIDDRKIQPAVWRHNARRVDTVETQHRVTEILGSRRLNPANAPAFSFGGLNSAGENKVRAADTCVPAADIGLLHKNLELTAEGGTAESTTQLVELTPDFMGNKVANKFLGWHYTSSNALSRTTHAVFRHELLGQKIQNLLKTAIALENNEGVSRFDDDYTFYSDLRSVLKDTSRAQAPLVKNLQLVVHGPGPNAVATVCNVNGYIYPTPSYFLVRETLKRHLQMVLDHANNGEDWAEHGPGRFYQEYTTSADKDAKLNGLCKKQASRNALIQLTVAVYSQMAVRLDGGTHQKHSLGANEAMAAVVSFSRALLLIQM